MTSTDRTKAAPPNDPAPGGTPHRYYVHDNKPVRVAEPQGAAPRAEYLNPDGTWSDADYWTVTVEGSEMPEHVALDFWQRHRPDVV